MPKIYTRQTIKVIYLRINTDHLKKDPQIKYKVWFDNDKALSDNI